MKVYLDNNVLLIALEAMIILRPFLSWKVRSMSTC